MIPKKYIDTQYTSVLFSPVFVSSHLRSFAANSLSATRRMGYSSRPLISIFRSHNCFRMNTYFARFSRHLSPFRINTSGSVHSKQLYLPLESTLMKKGGRGVQLLLTRNPKKALRSCCGFRGALRAEPGPLLGLAGHYLRPRLDFMSIAGQRANTDVVRPPRGVNSPRTTHHSGRTAATTSRRILLTAFS